ncbi:hypothetical protein EIP91_011675 [Steccherinum ochraceum]|uniref:Cytochrome P450 n=1 Tax=Steccherinum ochraceum TaxID=92696 RepID=A0A4R0RKE4_9APHY|nr:hypothetical protein EIP91_011675 [Steccherinum ochraceum]
MDVSTALLLTLAVVYSTIVYILTRQRRFPSFPGPIGYPIIGTILPQENTYVKMMEYSKQYGPVYALRVLSTRVLSAARELLEVRSGIYSNRLAPKMIEMIGLDDGIIFQPQPSRLREGRKLLASGLQPRELEAFRPVIQAAVVRFLSLLLKEPKDFLSHLHRSRTRLPTAVSLEIAYGYTAASGKDDPFATRMKSFVKGFDKAAAVSVNEGFAVNWLPFLSYLPSWLPGLTFKRVARTWKKELLDTLREGFDRVKDEVARGVAKPSVLSCALEDGSSGYTEDVMLKSLPELFTGENLMSRLFTTSIQLMTYGGIAGGSETSISAMSTFFLAMTLNSEVQFRAQEELDRVIGSGRLPTYGDRDGLPYVMAVMTEVLRWHTPLPCVYRTSTKDDVYEGCFVAKGSTLLVNLWAMFHDEARFTEPGKFKPERWLGGCKPSDERDVDPLELAFGFGRRVCPGKYMAQELLFNVIASTLAVFNIRKAKDDNGNEITPSVIYSNGSMPYVALRSKLVDSAEKLDGIYHPHSAPLPFQCEVVPRSQQAVSLVDDAWN